MSTLRVSSIKNASSATGGLDIAADGSVTGALPSPNRNLLYNGAMQCHQRGTSVTGISSGGYRTADRWSLDFAGGSAWTQTIENDGPPGSGIVKSLKMLCTTATASPAAGAVVAPMQLLEGQDLQRIAKGTASAQQLTLSFWAKSNVTGTFTVLLYDNDNARGFSASYTISASATWEKKSIVVPADATGAFDNDNAYSLGIYFHLSAGTDFTSGASLMSTWQSYTANRRAVGQVNVAAATNNYWQITGVQLEVGDTATGFEFKSFGQELRECQRYYYRMQGSAYTRFGVGFNTSTTVGQGHVQFPVPLRANPTAMDTTGTAANYAVFHSGGTVTACNSIPTMSSDISPFNAAVNFPVASGLTQGAVGVGVANNTTAAYLGFSAEL